MYNTHILYILVHEGNAFTYNIHTLCITYVCNHHTVVSYKLFLFSFRRRGGCCNIIYATMSLRVYTFSLLLHVLYLSIYYDINIVHIELQYDYII